MCPGTCIRRVPDVATADVASAAEGAHGPYASNATGTDAGLAGTPHAFAYAGTASDPTWGDDEPNRWLRMGQRSAQPGCPDVHSRRDLHSWTPRRSLLRKHHVRCAFIGERGDWPSGRRPLFRGVQPPMDSTPTNTIDLVSNENPSTAGWHPAQPLYSHYSRWLMVW